MPPEVPHRPHLAKRLWLAQRFGRAGGPPEATGHALGRAMSIESLEHMVRNRVRMFLRHTWLATILGTIVLVGAVTMSIYYFTMATVVRVAAGPEGSANAKFVRVLSDTLARGHDKIRLELVPTLGAQASAQALANGQADLAVLPSNIGNTFTSPVIAILRQNVMVFIVPPPSAVTAPPAKPEAAKPVKTAKAGRGKGAKAAKAASDDSNDDTDKSSKPAKGGKGTKEAKDDSDSSDDSNALKVSQLGGKRIGIVRGNEATPDMLDLVLKHYGVTPGSVKVSLIDPTDLPNAIHAGQVDVLFVAGSATGSAITNAVSAATHEADAPTFIEIDQADGIAKRNPAFDSVDIDAGTFGGNPPTPNDSLKSLSFPEFLVVKKSFDHSIVATLAKDIYVNRQSLAAAMAGDVRIEAPSTDKDAAVTVSSAAAAYLTDSQQSFFDKYGDDIFYGMLIFPVFGSAIAGIASYLRHDSRTRRLRLLQRVLDLVRKAHNAQGLETIEHLQVEADNLVISIIHLSEHEEFDESVRMSFSFALDQLRFAIAARRTAILDHMSNANTTGGGSTKAAAQIAAA